MSKRFEIGKLVSTAGVHAAMEEQPEFSRFVNDSLMRYFSGDWGDTCEEEAKQNDWSADNDERILAVYDYPGNEDLTIWIITEWDRSTTTILFPSEY